MFWALWHTLGIINSCCFSSLPSPSLISSLFALSLTASSLFLGESQQLAGTSWVILYVTQNPLCWLPWCFKRGAVAAAAKHPGYSGRARLWSPEASCWQEPGAAQGSKVPGWHGFAESEGSCCCSEASPEGTPTKIQTDRSRVIWPLKASACQEIVLKLPELWQKALSSASGCTVGLGWWSHSPFPVNWVVPGLRPAHMEAWSCTFPPESKCWPV